MTSALPGILEDSVQSKVARSAERHTYFAYFIAVNIGRNNPALMDIRHGAGYIPFDRIQ